MKKNPFHSYHLDTSYLAENHLTGEDFQHLSHSLIEYPFIFFKWLLAAVLIGLVAGVEGILFRYFVTWATLARESWPWLLYLLPLAGLGIAFIYHRGAADHDPGANLMIVSVRKGKTIPWKIAPRILVSTVLTHLCGGSAGKEGAALQLGGVVGSQVSQLLKFDSRDTSLAIICGMSAFFSALFGTPIAAAIFALEVISVGVMYYVGLLPAVISALIACQLSMCFGLEPLYFSIAIPDISFLLLAKLLLLVVVCAVISIVFCVAVHKTLALADRVFHNIFVQVVLGGIVIVVLSILLGTSDYNGLGMHVIERAMQGQAAPFSWGWKLIFTAITIGFGYKGGEIVPVMFVGATLGCVMGQFLGMEPGLGAAVGMIALFCGVTNCPLASIVMSVELFGSAGLALFACTAAVSYLFSGYYGLYGSQHINYSKLRAEFINRSAD